MVTVRTGVLAQIEMELLIRCRYEKITNEVKTSFVDRALLS
ncbi:hypothetical protein ACHAW5_009227 [Stephanodiscus triporus]|uniref:Uncharacterized protein n=1 Tax=Stephanodiscus triporus TaxID=2934178 RepID=A0ABD3PLG6_9STRA